MFFSYFFTRKIPLKNSSYADKESCFNKVATRVYICS